MTDTKRTIQTWGDVLAAAKAGCPVRVHSGEVESGDIFVAVPGAAVDGARFIPDACKRGAACVIAATQADIPECDTVLIRHDDPREAVGELANATLGTDALPFELIGVTGTNGKTTTCYMIEHLVAEQGRKPGLLGTVAYRWPGTEIVSKLTTPGCWQIHEMFARMTDSGVQTAVMEVSSHAVDQKRVAGLTFDVAVMTNLTQDHLDYHGDMETYFAAKKGLFTTYLKKGGAVVLNRDDAYSRELLKDMPQAIAYGLEKETGEGNFLTGRALSGTIKAMGSWGIKLVVTWQGETLEITSGLPGKHNAYNMLAAIGAVIGAGMPFEAALGFSTFRGVPGRLERVVNERGLDVFVDYAHTPDALENVLSALKPLTTGRLIAIFGCGGDRDKTKRPLMAEAAARWADIPFLTTDNPRSEVPEAIIEDARPGLGSHPGALIEVDRREAIFKAVAMMEKGDVLVIAGKGHENYQEIKGIRHDYSDVRTAEEALS